MKCKLPELLRIHQECRLMVSGIKRIAIANWEDTYKFTSSNDCNIDSIDLNDEHFYEINFAEGSAYANANVNAGSNSEQKSVQHQVGFVLPVIDCKLIDNWKNYLLARVIFAVETKSNQVFIFGADSGLSPTNFDYSTGATETDTNGITALFEASQTNAPLIVQDWSLIEALYPQDEPDYSKEYLTFEALESGTFTLSLYGADSAKDTTLSVSLDNGKTWTEITAAYRTTETYTTPAIGQGDKVLWKGNNKQLATSVYRNITNFSSTGRFNVSGNIMSLLYGDDFENQTAFPTGSEYAFRYLFRNASNLVSASNLILSATTLANYCYSSMFYGCTSLTTAPELSATTLANYCYDGMFSRCTSLTTAPELPSTTLASGCYDAMFQGCTALTTAPELNATTLANSCYSFMFDGCTNLTTAPSKLPATTLNTYCYASMFQDCTSLTTAPTLPATTLTSSCYNNMFGRCTSLTTAPELPAARLASSCYYSMFQGCRSLNRIKMLATDISATDCLKNWVTNVASSGIFTKAADMTTLPTGNSGIPENWTVISERN